MNMNEMLLAYIIFCNDLLGKCTYSGHNRLVDKYCGANCKRCKMRLVSSKCYQIKLRDYITKKKKHE